MIQVQLVLKYWKADIYICAYKYMKLFDEHLCFILLHFTSRNEIQNGSEII